MPLQVLIGGIEPVKHLAGVEEREVLRHHAPYKH
jgi:hypothetical protein